MENETLIIMSYLERVRKTLISQQHEYLDKGFGIRKLEDKKEFIDKLMDDLTNSDNKDNTNIENNELPY